MAKKARGEVNANPGNIEYNGTPWQGLDEPPSDGRFCRFTHPKWGIRAISRTLISYQDKHGIRTVRGIINRWAPPVENDTGAYVAAVARNSGLGPDEHLDLHSYEHQRPLVEAIIRHELGYQPYSGDLIDLGLELAGVTRIGTPAAPPLKSSPEMQAGGGAAATGAAITAAEAADAVQALESGERHLSAGTVVGLLLGLAIVSLGLWLVYRRYRERVQGLR